MQPLLYLHLENFVMRFHKSITVWMIRCSFTIIHSQSFVKLLLESKLEILKNILINTTIRTYQADYSNYLADKLTPLTCCIMQGTPIVRYISCS